MGWRIASVVFGISALISWAAALGIGADYLAEQGWPVQNGEAWFNAIFMTFIAGGTGAKANKSAEADEPAGHQLTNLGDNNES